MFDDAGLVAEIGEQHIFWSANQAIERLAELNRLAESETSPQEPPAESLDELPLGISVV